MTATVVELRGGERAGVEQVEPELEVARVRGPHRRGVDDRAHAIAVHDRKAARVELDAVDQPRIEQADRAQEILQVERLVQPQPVEHDRGLVRLAAAHRADAGEAVGGRAGQALHGAQRLVGEARHVLHLLLREERARREIAGREPIAAGLHDDLFELALPAQVRCRGVDRSRVRAEPATTAKTPGATCDNARPCAARISRASSTPSRARGSVSMRRSLGTICVL